MRKIRWERVLRTYSPHWHKLVRRTAREHTVLLPRGTAGRLRRSSELDGGQPRIFPSPIFSTAGGAIALRPFMLSFIFNFMRSRRTAIYLAVYGMAALSFLGCLTGHPFWATFAWLWSFSAALGCISAGLGFFARGFFSLITGDIRGLL